MNYLSICSGIEAATVAWHPLGWNPVAFAEVDAFPSAVLKYHYSHIPNWGDITRYKEWPDVEIDLLVGGTPCQSFSVAGLRKGLADPRGNLSLVYLGIAERYKPQLLLWENVPGVLSSYTTPDPPGDLAEGEEWETEETSDFWCFLQGLAELGYGFAYRVLDAQFFGVPQRRRRVFVVGCSRGWAASAAVLFERHSLSGDTPPRRETREVVADLTARGVGTCGADDNQGQAGHLVPFHVMAHGQGNAEIVSDGDPSLTCNHEAPIVCSQYGPLAGALTARHDSSPCADRGQNIIAFEPGVMSRCGGHIYDNISGCLRKAPGDNMMSVAAGLSVRRLTPIECERLQGFNDNYTRIPWRGKPVEQCPDGPRYKALGNSMAVPVMRWIGRRIMLVENVHQASKNLLTPSQETVTLITNQPSRRSAMVDEFFTDLMPSAYDQMFDKPIPAHAMPAQVTIEPNEVATTANEISVVEPEVQEEPGKKPCPKCNKLLTWVADGSRPRSHKCIEEAPQEAKPAAAQPQAPAGITADVVIAKYVETRDEIARIKKEADEKIAGLKVFQDKREQWLLSQLDNLGLTSMKTGAGTAFVTHKDSATVADREAFLGWVQENWQERNVFIENRVAKTAVKELVEADQVPPPGINYTKIRDINIRRS